MPTDTASSGVTATTAVRIPVLTSGAEAIRAARNLAAFLADGAIERDRSGALPVRELAALDASGQLATKVHAAQALLASAAAVLDEVTRTPAARWRSPRPRRSAARSPPRWRARCSRSAGPARRTSATT